MSDYVNRGYGSWCVRVVGDNGEEDDVKEDERGVFLIDLDVVDKCERVWSNNFDWLFVLVKSFVDFEWKVVWFVCEGLEKKRKGKKGLKRKKLGLFLSWYRYCII